MLNALVTLAVVASVARALRGYGRALEGRLEHVQLGWLGAAVVMCVVYRAINAYGWVLVLRSLGATMPAARGVRLWLVSEALRWLPGSVWSMFSRVARARDAGVPAVTASLSVPLELLLCVASWALTACAGVALSGAAQAWLSQVHASWAVAVAAALALAVGAPFAVARWLPSSRVSKKLRGLQEALRELRASRPRVSLLLLATALFTALCVFNGATFLAVLRATCESPPGLLATVGVNAVGWLVGFFAFFAPAGLGVREGGMVAMLAPMMPFDAVVVGVLLWRLVQIAAEMVCLGACLVSGTCSTDRPAESVPAEVA
jgi:hypothetical protein